jgi:hypothetical protein
MRYLLRKKAVVFRKQAVNFSLFSTDVSLADVRSRGSLGLFL